MNIELHKAVSVILTNKSGSFLAWGAVVVLHTFYPAAVTTTTTAAYATSLVGVVAEPNGLIDGARGRIIFSGYVDRINLSASVDVGSFLKTTAVAGQAVSHAAPVASGDFGMSLGSGTAPAAVLFTMGSGSGGSSVSAAISAASLVYANTTFK